MRICYLSSTFPKSSHDSWAFFLRELAHGLASGKNEVVVITQRYRGSLPRERIENIVVERFNWISPRNFQRLADYKKVPYLRMVSYFLSAVFRTIRVIVRNKLDVIYAHWVVPSGFIALLAKKVTHRPLIVQVHGSDLRGSWAKHPVMRSLTNMTLKRIDGLVTDSKDLMQRAERMGIKINLKKVVPTGVDLKSLEHGLPVKKRKNDIPTILFAGALRRVKGLTFLLDAIPLIKKEIPAFKLIIAGDGPLRDQLENNVKTLHISEYVDFLGQIPNDQLLNVMKSSDVCILPSLSEGTPTVLFEALACKTPLIATRVGGISEVITHKDTGILIEPRNARAIADAVINLLQDNDTRQKLAEQGYSLIKSQYTIDKTASTLIEFFTMVLKQWTRAGG